MNKYLWSGIWWKDYVFFVANWHPLLAILFCHPSHPWTRLKRLGMLFFSCSFTFLIADLQLRDADNKAMKWFALFACVTLPAMIMETLLYMIVTLPAQFEDRGGRWCGWTCSCFNRLSKWLKVYCLCKAFLLAIVMIIATVYMAADYHDSMDLLGEAVLRSRIQSAIIWFAISMVNPWSGFIVCWRAQKAKHPLIVRIANTHAQDQNRACAS